MARSSRNRLTHGLCGPHTGLSGEDPAEYEHLLDALLEEHKPAGPTETLLVAQLAQAQWKLNRIAAIEADLFAKQILHNEANGAEPSLAEAFERASKSLAALARHEAAARRAFDKALGNLWKLQGPRRRGDVERAGHAELEGFIDAYVNAPMPGTSTSLRGTSTVNRAAAAAERQRLLTTQSAPRPAALPSNRLGALLDSNINTHAEGPARR